jgi:hypothetical protein
MAAPGTRRPGAEPPPAWPAARSVASVVIRPGLWGTAAAQLLRLAPRRWWRRWPPVPRPDRGYLRFRAETMWGDARHQPDPDDLVAYLRWCRSMRDALR